MKLRTFNLLQPTGHVMLHQFNIQQLHAPPYCIYVFCIYHRTNSDLCHLQHKLIGFYNRDLTLYSLLVTLCTTSITFNKCTLCPHCIYVFCIYHRTNSELCLLKHNIICFYIIDFFISNPLVTIRTTTLTFRKCTLCVHYICVLYLSQNKQQLLPLTA